MESWISGSQIAKQALTYLNVPFRHRGRNRAGIDCAGLVVCTLKDLGILPDGFMETAYYNMPENGLVESTLNELLIPTEETKEGYIMMFNAMNYPCHVGICLDESEFIHSFQGAKKVTKDSYITGSWAKRFIQSYRAI